MNTSNLTMVIIFSFLFSILLPAYMLADDNRLSRLKSDVEYLCSPQLEGRNVPSKGGDLTAEWLGDNFAEMGLKPGASSSSFFQDFQLIQSKIDTSLTTLIIYLPDRKVPLNWGSQFLLFPRKIANYNAELELTYAHYGIKSAELDRDDFGDKTVGKAALVLDGIGDLPAGRAGRHGMTPFKAVAAKRAGAKLMVVMYSEDNLTWPPKKLQRKISDSKSAMTDLPDSKQEFLTIHLNGADKLSEAIFKILAAGNQNGQIKVHLDLVFKKPVIHKGQNIIGIIPGKTPDCILIGAHYDHLGIEGNADDGTLLYYPGANDNASGVSVLLEISRLWKNREQPSKGLIVVAFGAEEDGKLGSKFFADNLPVHRINIVAMINLDMIGRDGYASMREVRMGNSTPDPDYTALYYSSASPDILRIAKGSGIKAGLNVDYKAISRFPFSDAGSFNSIGIPTISIFSGFHSGYSELNDLPEFINWNKLAKMILLTDKLLINFNRMDSDIIFDKSLKPKLSQMKY